MVQVAGCHVTLVPSVEVILAEAVGQSLDVIGIHLPVAVSIALAEVVAQTELAVAATGVVGIVVSKERPVGPELPLVAIGAYVEHVLTLFGAIEVDVGVQCVVAAVEKHDGGQLADSVAGGHLFSVHLYEHIVQTLVIQADVAEWVVGQRRYIRQMVIASPEMRQCGVEAEHRPYVAGELIFVYIYLFQT